MSLSDERLVDFAKRSGVLDDPEVRKLVLAAGLSQSEFLQDSISKAVVGRSLQHFQ